MADSFIIKLLLDTFGVPSYVLESDLCKFPGICSRFATSDFSEMIKNPAKAFHVNW